MNASRRPSVPTASASGPPGNWVRSWRTVATRLSIDVLVFHASPRNWVASASAWIAGVFDPNGLTCPLLSSRSEEHTSELQSRLHLVCRLLLEKKKNKKY